MTDTGVVVVTSMVSSGTYQCEKMSQLVCFRQCRALRSSINVSDGDFSYAWYVESGQEFSKSTSKQLTQALESN